MPGGGDDGLDPVDPDPSVAPPDGKPGELQACKHVDIVISLDDSMSMREERDSMRNVVFPAFASALEQVGNGDIHFRTGVMDACPNPATFHTRGASGECNFWGGKPWMLSGSPRLPDEFSCVGEIDSSDSVCTGDNDDEQPASTIAAALEGPMAPTGFMREGALLVAVAITDEDEQPTPNQSAREVYERLVAVKGGDVYKMAFLGVGASRDCQGVYGEAREAVKLKRITDEFGDRGLFWDLCEGRLEDGLSAVVTLIDKACDEFCMDPDGCDPGTGQPPDPPGDDDCVEHNDCPSGEFCQEGTCAPIIG